jgi:hypothetical protein
MKDIKTKKPHFTISLLFFLLLFSFSNLPLVLNAGEPQQTEQISTAIPSFGSYKFEVGFPTLFEKDKIFYFTKNTDPFFMLTKTIIDLGLALSGLILFIVLVYAGIVYATSAGNPKKIQEAQQRIIEALIGFFLLFSFYVILNTINPNILKSSPFGISETTPENVSEYIPEYIPEETSPVTPFLPKSYVKIGPGTEYNVPLSSEFKKGAYINKALAEKLALLAKKYNKGWQITEACLSVVGGYCQTTVPHSSKCHNNGTCVDIGGGGLGNPNIKDNKDYRAKFIKDANELGLAVLDEYECPQYGSGLHVGLADICQPNNSCWHCPTSH